MTESVPERIRHNMENTKEQNFFPRNWYHSYNVTVRGVFYNENIISLFSITGGK